MKSQIQLDVGFDKDFMKIFKKKKFTLRVTMTSFTNFIVLPEIPRNSEVRSNKAQ